MDKININHKSDFKLIAGYKDSTPITSSPFRFTFYTSTNGTKLTAEYDGERFTNCIPTDDGRVKIPFDNHNLGVGTLYVTTQLSLTDSDFNDGKYNYNSDDATNIILGRGTTDTTSDVEVFINKPNTNGIGMSLLKPYNTVTLEDGGVTTEKIADYAITTSKIATGAITPNKITSGAITSDKISAFAVSTIKIANGAVTNDKLSDDIRNRINNGQYIHAKFYERLNSVQSGWYLLAEIDDNDATLFQVSTKGHSDVLFSAVTGWEGASNGSLTILNSFTDGFNNNYAHVKGVRLRKDTGLAKIEIQLQGPIVNDYRYVCIRVTALSNSATAVLKDSLSLSSVQGDSDVSIINSFTLENGTMFAKKIRSENIDDLSARVAVLESIING